jgi:hypothetical protein
MDIYKTMTPYDGKPAQPLDADNTKLVKTSDIKTNSDYRKYMTAKADVIRAYTSKEYSKTLK